MQALVYFQSCSDPTRLRLLNLLREGPLCVCHFQTILQEPQVKISKHLGYLRRQGLVTVRRSGNWMIYSLPARRSTGLTALLEALPVILAKEPQSRKDLNRLKKLDLSCSPVAAIKSGRTSSCSY